jgi:DNA-binding transcriptional ArsR family regulator
MSPPAVSHHLRSLKQLGVITSRRIGKEVHYTIADTADGALVSDLLKTVFERKGMYEEDI